MFWPLLLLTSLDGVRGATTLYGGAQNVVLPANLSSSYLAAFNTSLDYPANVQLLTYGNQAVGMIASSFSLSLSPFQNGQLIPDSMEHLFLDLTLHARLQLLAGNPTTGHHHRLCWPVSSVGISELLLPNLNRSLPVQMELSLPNQLRNWRLLLRFRSLLEYHHHGGQQSRHLAHIDQQNVLRYFTGELGPLC